MVQLLRKSRRVVGKEGKREHSAAHQLFHQVTAHNQEGLRHWVVGEGVAEEDLSPERRLNGSGCH